MPSPGRSRRCCPRCCAGWGAKTRRCSFGRAPTSRNGIGRCASRSSACPGASSATVACWLASPREAAGLQHDQLSRGILHFATDAADFDAMARHAEAARALGAEREIKSGAECVALEPALSRSMHPVMGGVFTPRDESGDAHRFTRELARLAAARGVAFRFGTAVEALETGEGKVLGIRAHDGERITGDAYVVSMGSYSPLLLHPLGMRIPVYPLKGYSVTLALGPEDA